MMLTSTLQVLSMTLKGVTGKGFSRAIRNWRNLEEISFFTPKDEHYTHVMQEIGINCRKLDTLSIVCYPSWYPNLFHLNEYNSQVIASNVRNLGKLAFSNCYVHKFGLLTILSKCRRLKVLELTRCWRALEEANVTKRTRALDKKPISYKSGHLSVTLKKSEGSRGEWLVDTLAGVHNIMYVIEHLWTEAGDAV
ncbi:hypothetical protein AQUCO_01800137v1 [Aquilegia coerulea]|uniref:Uncharacterized protein n=1 Tax=Aquilegia coerulea TaxID=218851 RepID=A0A2G5DKV5_AQUCA|nr:hypothetical protein AQUCO_01800137v1 [Aquilegia coerulea]